MKQFQKNFPARLVVATVLMLCAVVSVGVFHFSEALGGTIVQEGGGGGGGGGVTYACSDGIDNDGNGLIDYPADPGCTSATDTTEAGYTQPPVITQCNDGIDNDGNGPIDYPADLGCTSASDTTEAGYVTTVCSDTIDNDLDGATDLADPGCSSAADTSEDPNPQCSDGKDNDLNGKIDYPADLGCTSATDNDESGYIPPAVPGSGVVEYSDRPDYIVVTDPAGGTTLSHFDSTYHGTGASPSVQGQRVCYDVDPTAFESYWEVGGFHSCGDNSMVRWDGSLWHNGSACSPSNNHYHILNCTTLAVPDTALTANGQTGTITVTQGNPVTLAWHSTYGLVRKGTFTATNFSMTTTTPAYCVDVQVRTCQTCSAGTTCQIAEVQEKPNSNQLAFTSASCTIDWQTNCYPEVTQSKPYDSSATVVPPLGDTTYTYTGTNGNGSSFKSVTVHVVGATQCTDGIDNDGDGRVDAADPACQTPAPPNPGPCPGGCEYDEKPELSAGAVTPTTVPLNSATTISATVTNAGGAGTGAGFINLFQKATDSSGTGATDIGTYSSAALAVNGTVNATLSYTFTSAGTTYVRACADKASAAGTGTIAERDETNNCSAWTAITVSSPPSGSLTANDTSVVYGNATTLNSTCNNATSGSINNGIGAVAVPTDAKSTGNLTSPKSYILTCVGSGGTTQYFASVSVTSPALTFTATKTIVRPGDSSTITWNTDSHAMNCKVSGSGYSATGYSGSHTFTNIQSQATYTFSCDGSTPNALTISIVPTYKEQ